MKTRNLILLALACGLAILVAGGVFLWNVAANRDELTLAEALRVGEGTEVGGRLVTVSRVETGAVTLVEVTIDPRGLPGGSAADGWALVAGGTLVDPAPAPPLVTDEACSAVPVQTAPVTCVLTFDAVDGAGTLSYAFAGDQRQWRIP